MAAATETNDWTRDARFGAEAGVVAPVTAAVVMLIAVVGMREHAAIRPDTPLDRDVGFDELVRVDLAVSLEARFGIAISDDDAEAWATAGNVVAFVRRRLLRGAA